MSKHTPGPWDLDEGDKATIYELDTGNPIAEVFSDRKAEENETNARLIAAAPDLLEALKYLNENSFAPEHGCHCVSLPYPPCHDCLEWGALREAMEMARAAINKAEGRT